MKQSHAAFRLDIPARCKNPWFWVGLAGVILSAMGADPAAFTSWQALYTALAGLLCNPYQLAAVFVAVLGVFVDPTTKGFGDGERAAVRWKSAGKGRTE